MNDDNDDDHAQHVLDNDVDNEVEEDGSDWEEVAIEQPQELEITIQQSDRISEVKSVFLVHSFLVNSCNLFRKKTQPRGISLAERILRIDSHKFHTLCLTANARARNTWLNDELLHVCISALSFLPGNDRVRPDSSPSLPCLSKPRSL